MAPDMRFRVVSLPATIRSRKKRSSSSWSSFSPSTSASIRTETRSCLGLEPAVRRQLLGVAVDLHGGLARVGAGDLVLGVVGADHAVGPVEDHAAVLLGHAEQLGDDEERELGRDLLDEVGRAALAHRVDDAVGVPDDLLLQVAHHLGGEALVDQPAVARVHGRVHVDHHQLLLGQLVVVHLVEERGRGGPRRSAPSPG